MSEKHTEQCCMCGQRPAFKVEERGTGRISLGDGREMRVHPNTWYACANHADMMRLTASERLNLLAAMHAELTALRSSHAELLGAKDAEIARLRGLIVHIWDRPTELNCGLLEMPPDVQLYFKVVIVEHERLKGRLPISEETNWEKLQGLRLNAAISNAQPAATSQE